jgi:hypothetical protein
MMHLSNGEACKHFNRVNPKFSVESKNMCLGLYIDKFNQFKLFV